MKKRILYVTGTRADFELMLPTLEMIKKDPGLELRILATDMHFDKTRGYTLSRVKKLFKTKKWPDISNLANLSLHLLNINPDIVLLLGDRLEALLAATMSVAHNIPVYHISGGDVSGSVDDSYRHAISKLAHIHMPGTPKSALRLREMGEEDWRIKLVGHVMNKKVVSKEKLEKKLKMKVDKDTIIVLQHPVVQEKDYSEKQIICTLLAVRDTGKKAVVILPNNDAGSEKMIPHIEGFSIMHRTIKCVKSLPGPYFNALLRHAGVLVGNSSSGITEAPHWGLPVVNIGTRQRGREQADNVVNVGYDKEGIREAVMGVIGKRIVCGVNPYKSKDVERSIIKVLKKKHDKKELLDKKVIL